MISLWEMSPLVALAVHRHLPECQAAPVGPGGHQVQGRLPGGGIEAAAQRLAVERHDPPLCLFMQRLCPGQEAQAEGVRVEAGEEDYPKTRPKVSWLGTPPVRARPSLSRSHPSRAYPKRAMST